jgi:hypothetical protein
VFVALTLTSFFTSHYLNEIAESHQRATVLSFKGLAFNAAYGGIGLVFAGLMQRLRDTTALLHPEWPAARIEDQAFRLTMGYFPWYLVIGLLLVSLLCLSRLRRHRGATGQ